MKRECSNGWLMAYLEMNEGQESPPRFHIWVGVSILSAVLRRNVWLDRGHFILFPNLYTVLVSASAECHKSTAVKKGKELLVEANAGARSDSERTNIFAQKLTPQALLHFLAQKSHAQGIAICEELTTFLDQDSIRSGMVPLLLELYDDPKGEWTYETITRDKDVLVDPSICLLGATTPTALKKSFPANTIGEGLISRINFVVGDTPGEPHAHPKPPPGYVELRRHLIADLTSIQELYGGFRWGEGAAEWYEEWYNNNFIRSGDCPLPAPYWTRRRDFLLKLAMIISVSHEDTLELTVPHLEVALRILKDNEKYVPQVEQGIKLTDFSSVADQVYNIIEANKEITHSDLFRKVAYYMEDGAATFNSIIQTLTEQGMITVYVSDKGHGGRIYKANPPLENVQ